MRKLERFGALFLAFALTLSLCSPAFAADQAQVDAANTLYTLGLFSGTGTDAAGNPNFDLDRTPTRAEAVVMLVRLLGKEAEAKAGQWQTPFTDTAAYSWALPYIGYAYTNGLAQGNGTSFDGASPTTATQYLTFVLRALGYDSKTDFQWDKAVEFASSLGLYFNANQAFTRGTVADVSFQTLSLTKKRDTATLLQQLVDSGAVTEDKAVSAGLENLLRDPSTPMTLLDVAHFLVSNYPIKSYVNHYSISDLNEETASSPYAADLLTALNAGVLEDSTGYYSTYSSGWGLSYASFAYIMSSFFIKSGCNVDAIAPREDETEPWYDDVMPFMVKLGVFSANTVSYTDAPVSLLSSETVGKLKGVPGWERAGTVNVYEETYPFKYVELEGKTYLYSSWTSPKIKKINLNGVESLYVVAPTANITTADSSGGPLLLSSILELAKGDYTTAANENPFLDGQIASLGEKGTVKTSAEDKYLSATEKKISRTVTVSGKSLTSADFPIGGIADIKGIEYVNGYLNINDVLAYYGIKKTVTLEKQGDLDVLCFR